MTPRAQEEFLLSFNEPVGHLTLRGCGRLWRLGAAQVRPALVRHATTMLEFLISYSYITESVKLSVCKIQTSPAVTFV